MLSPRRPSGSSPRTNAPAPTVRRPAWALSLPPCCIPPRLVRTFPSLGTPNPNTHGLPPASCRGWWPAGKHPRPWSPTGFRESAGISSRTLRLARRRPQRTPDLFAARDQTPRARFLLSPSHRSPADSRAPANKNRTPRAPLCHELATHVFLAAGAAAPALVPHFPRRDPAGQTDRWSPP